MKKFLIITSIISANSFADDGVNEIYNLSNNAMDIITHTKDFPSDGHFKLTTKEADLALSLGKNDYLIGEYIGATKNSPESAIGCQEFKYDPKEIAKKFNDRSFRVGALLTYSQNDFEKSEQFKYSRNEYVDYMNRNGISVLSTSKYNWDNLIKRFSGYNSNDDAGANSEKLAAFLKSETGLDIPKGTLASEFMYRDLLKNPEDWKKTLEKSRDALSFDEKIKLVAKLGNEFNNDYNFQRTEKNSSENSSIVSTENLLRNLSTSDSGGVCREVSLSQSQMLKALGVTESYSVAYNSNRGGHATLIVVDPNDKNRIVKLNYGDVKTDDGKKGAAVLDQDNSLPNVGMRFRIYDNEGKPVASVPTELGNILKEVTGQDKDFAHNGSAQTLNKVYFSNDKMHGSLFNGKTSNGETVNGVALHGKPLTNELLEVKAGVTAFQAQTDKSYYNMKKTGLYGYGTADLRTTVYDGQYGKLGAGVGGSMEVILMNTASNSSVYNENFSQKTVDAQYGLHSRSTYEVNLTDKDKISLSAQVNARFDKDNVADEGKKSFHYESTVFISSYEHEFNDNLKASLEVSSKLGNFGNSSTFQAALQENSNKYILGGSLASSDAPSFLSGQNTVSAGYERATKSGWDFRLEYLKNLESDNQQINFGATKKY